MKSSRTIFWVPIHTYAIDDITFEIGRVYRIHFSFLSMNGVDMAVNGFGSGAVYRKISIKDFDFIMKDRELSGSRVALAVSMYKTYEGQICVKDGILYRCFGVNTSGFNWTVSLAGGLEVDEKDWMSSYKEYIF